MLQVIHFDGMLSMIGLEYIVEYTQSRIKADDMDECH